MVFDGVTIVGIDPVEIVTGDDTINSAMRFRARFVDRNNFRMGVGAAQHFGVGHADEPQICDVLGFAGDFDPAVAARQRMINDVKIALLLDAHDCFSFAINAAARSMAATIGT